MGGRFRLEAWTLPSSAEFKKKMDVPALHGSAGTRELSGYADEQAIVAADWDGIDQVASATESSWMRVFDMDQVVDEFIAERVLKVDDRPSVRALTGPQRNGIVERFAVYPYRWPADKPQAQDWIWGGENALPDLGLADLDSIREEWTLYLSGERYELDVSLATTGTYLLNVGSNTNPIAFDADGSTIKSELEGLAGVDEVTVLQPDPDRREFVVVFESPKDLAANMTADFTGTGGLGTLTKLNDGFDTGTDPTFTATVDGDTTEALPWDATASQLEGVAETLNPPGSGLQGLTTVADVLVSGSGTAADPWTWVFYDPPIPGSVSVTFAAGTAVLEKTVSGAADPSPITRSQEIDQSVDENIHGTYGDPALEVVTDPAHVDAGADWALKVNATGRFAGSQIVVPVTPGMTYQARIRVKPTVTGDYTLVIRGPSGDLIAQPAPRDNTLTAGAYADIVVVDIEVPDNVDRVIMRVAVTDDSPAKWAVFYVNWQLAELREGQLEATPGRIMRQLLEACHARGTATFVELGCTDLVDSAGVAWPSPMSFTVFFGANAHLGVALAQLHENGYEWRVDAKAAPAGGVTHTLNLWNKGPVVDHTSSSGAPTVVVGSDVVDARVASRFAPFTALLAHGLEGLRLEDVNDADAAVAGRWERIVDAEHLASEEALQEFLTAQFDEEASNRTAASAIVLGSDPQPPLTAYSEGDQIWWHFPGILERQAKTVRRISWTLGDEVQYEVQGSRVLTPEAAMAAAVDKLLGQFRRRSRRPKVTATTPTGTGTAPPGAHIHLERSSAQSLTSGTATAVSWTAYQSIPLLNFAAPAFPADAVTIQQPGYYDVQVMAGLASAVTSAEVAVVRVRAGVEETVWPPVSDPGVWAPSYSTKLFSGVAKGIPCLSGDQIKVYVTQTSGSAVNLSSASLAIELVDHTTGSVPAFTAAATSYHGVGALTVHPVTLPSASSGDMLLMVVNALSSPTTPTGWTLLETASPWSFMRWYYKISDGSEAGSVNVTLLSAGQLSAVAWRVNSNDLGATVPDSNVASGVTAPTLTVTNGSGRYAVFAAAAYVGFEGPSGPAGYDEVEVHDEAGPDDPSAYVSMRTQNLSTTVSPGTIAWAATLGGVHHDRNIATIAVKLED